MQVIVVDNASSDDSVALTREYFPQVEIIQNEKNMGFAVANNFAMEMAKGRYFLLLNTDAFLHDGAVQELVRTMDDFPDTGAAGCRLYYEDGTLQPSCSSFPTIFTELWQVLWLDRLFPNHPVFGKYLLTYWKLDDFREVDSVMGACMILNREAIHQVGKLDETYFMYSEEVDLCYRLKQAGWKVRFTPNASATHIWGGSSRKMKRENFLNLYKSRILFFRKHYGRIVTFLYKLLLMFGSTIRVMSGGIASLVKRDQDYFRQTNDYFRLLISVPGY